MIEPTTYELAILRGLQDKPAGAVYAGTVPARVVATRRRRNKAARIARRVTR